MIRRIAREALPDSATPSVASFTHASRAPLELELARADAYRTALARAEREIGERVNGILRELVGGELDTTPEHVRDVVASALARVRGARTLKLRVHPADGALLDEPAALQARHELAGVLEIELDADIARGGCVLESNLGEVDARLETRLELACALLSNRGRP